MKKRGRKTGTKGVKRLKGGAPIIDRRLDGAAWAVTLARIINREPAGKAALERIRNAPFALGSILRQHYERWWPQALASFAKPRGRPKKEN